ncbi:MAG: DUF1501 domain-containing protein [Planctomycetota bacterium]
MALNRRNFLQGSLGGLTLATLAQPVPAFLVQAAEAAAAQNDPEGRILVVLQMAGGNDGLNTVVPFENDVYGRKRTTLRLRANEVLKIEDHLGLNAELQTLWPMWQEGQFSIVQGVGHRGGNRDHGGAMRGWHTAMPDDRTCQTGWIGRALDAQEDESLPAAFVGVIPQPLALVGKRAVVPSIRSLRDLALHASSTGEAGRSFRQQLQHAAEFDRGVNNPLLAAARRNTQAAYQLGAKVEDALARTGRDSGDYPDYPLANTLRNVAALMRAQVGFRIFYVEHGGNEPGAYDTHANQAKNHPALLRELASSLAAFTNDLKRAGLLDRVLLFTFSEFGRTVEENGRNGTGHGEAQPVLMIGGGLQGGLVGKHPDMSDLAGDAPRAHTDFRRIYAAGLQWLGIDHRQVLEPQFAPLEVLKA